MTRPDPPRATRPPGAAGCCRVLPLPLRAACGALALLAASCLGPAGAWARPTAGDAPAAAAPAPAPAPGPVPVPAPEAHSAWGWPVPGTSPTSPRVLRGFEAPAQRWSPGHRGVDLAAEPGSAVLAPADGVVVFAGTVVDRGVLSVLTAGGLRATLEPVEASVPVGTSVRRGDVLGRLATSPAHCASGPCLHWGVRAGRDGYRDPLGLLRAAGPPVLLPLGPWQAPRPGARAAP